MCWMEELKIIETFLIDTNTLVVFILVPDTTIWISVVFRGKISEVLIFFKFYTGKIKHSFSFHNLPHFFSGTFWGGDKFRCFSITKLRNVIATNWFYTLIEVARIIYFVITANYSLKPRHARSNPNVMKSCLLLHNNIHCKPLDKGNNLQGHVATWVLSGD